MRLLTTFAAVIATSFVCSFGSTAAYSDALMNNGTDDSGSGIWSDEAPTPAPTEVPPPQEALCSEDEDEMSVEGVEGIFCVKKEVGCSADRAWGKCPGRQAGLPHGSYCGRVASGVFGCKPGMPYGEVPDYDDLDGSNEDSGSGSA